MKNIILGICCILFSFNAWSQYIQGTVLDSETHKPIEGVNVYMDNMDRGASTNLKGNYYLKFPFEKIDSGTIHFSHVGYKKLSIQYHYKQKEYLVYLMKEVTELSEIEIINERNLKPYLSHKTLKPMKTGVHAFGSILRNNKIYVIGGDASYDVNGGMKTLAKFSDSNLSFDEFLKRNLASYSYDVFKGDYSTYDIETNTWEVEKSKFSDRAYHDVQLYNNNLYVIGGKMLLKNRKITYLNDKIEVLNTEKDSIKIDETNPHQAVNFASFIYDDFLVMLGGSTKEKIYDFEQNKKNKKEFSNKMHVLNLKTGYWYELDTISKPKEANGILIQDKFYLIGGYNNTALSEIETYDMVTKTSQKEGDLFYGMENPAITYANNIIYIYNNGKIVTYNIVTNELNEYLVNLDIFSAKMHFYNNKLFILGGIKVSDYSITPSAALYSIDINEFKQTRVRKTKIL